MKPTRAFCLMLLLALLAAETGCATSEADLDYTRDQPAAAKSGDTSYHGWNNAGN